MKNNMVLAIVSGAVVSLGAVAGVQAQAISNPWTGDGAEVDININVGELGEVWSNVGTGQARDGDAALVLEITNAAGNVPPSGIAQDTLNHFANVNYEVYVDLDGDIPEWSRFHVLVNPSNSGAYDAVAGGGSAGATQAMADTIVTWDLRGANDYQGANVPGVPVLALSDVAVPNANQTPIEYVADAIHGLPSNTTTDFDVVWTIAAQ